jgi:hypothetical protein
MPTDQPNPPDPRPSYQLQTRELMARIVTRIRADLATVRRLAADIGANVPVPPEVDEAIVTLGDWTAELMRTARKPGTPGRPPKPPERPKP